MPAGSASGRKRHLAEDDETTENSASYEGNGEPARKKLRRSTRDNGIDVSRNNGHGHDHGHGFMSYPELQEAYDSLKPADLQARRETNAFLEDFLRTNLSLEGPRRNCRCALSDFLNLSRVGKTEFRQQLKTVADVHQYLADVCRQVDEDLEANKENPHRHPSSSDESVASCDELCEIHAYLHSDANAGVDNNNNPGRHQAANEANAQQLNRRQKLSKHGESSSKQKSKSSNLSSVKRRALMLRELFGPLSDDEDEDEPIEANGRSQDPHAGMYSPISDASSRPGTPDSAWGDTENAENDILEHGGAEDGWDERRQAEKSLGIRIISVGSLQHQPSVFQNQQRPGSSSNNVLAMAANEPMDQAASCDCHKIAPESGEVISIHQPPSMRSASTQGVSPTVNWHHPQQSWPNNGRGQHQPSGEEEMIRIARMSSEKATDGPNLLRNPSAHPLQQLESFVVSFENDKEGPPPVDPLLLQHRPAGLAPLPGPHVDLSCPPFPSSACACDQHNAGELLVANNLLLAFRQMPAPGFMATMATLFHNVANMLLQESRSIAEGQVPAQACAGQLVASPAVHVSGSQQQVMSCVPSGEELPACQAYAMQLATQQLQNPKQGCSSHVAAPAKEWVVGDVRFTAKPSSKGRARQKE